MVAPPAIIKTLKPANSTETRTITTQLPEGQNKRNESLQWLWNISVFQLVQKYFETEETY